jgi:ubiquitin-conjugating enzyme E2 Q
MPEQLKRMTFIDKEADDEMDAGILNPPSSNFTPSPEDRFAKLELMPPPTETSTVASKALQKEFKALIGLQRANSLPFYINPDTERQVASLGRVVLDP